MNEDYLAHYGRLGMKWGQHIYGKERTGSGQKRKKAESFIASRIRKHKERKAKIARGKALAEARAKKQKIWSTAEETYKHRNQLSNQDLRNAVERFRLENDLRSLAGKKVSKGQKFVNGLDKAVTGATKALNKAKAFDKATGGVLSGLLDQKLSDTSEVYRTIRAQVEPILEAKRAAAAAAGSNKKKK